MKRIRFGVKQKLLVVALVPLLIIGVTVTVISSTVLLDSMRSDAFERLEDVALSVAESLQLLSDGTYDVKDGELYKGDKLVSESMDMFNKITEDTGVYVTITYGKTRMVTTLKGTSTGTNISESVADDVLNKGNIYTDGNTEINGTRYFSCYVPLREEDGTIVGCVFAGNSAGYVLDFVDYEMKRIIFWSAVILALSSIVVIFFARRITKAIGVETGIITEISSGDMTVEIGEKLLTRRDEIGDMSNAISTLASRISEIVKSIKSSADSISGLGDSLEDMSSTVSNNSDEITKAVSEVSSGAIMQASEIENATQEMSSVGEKIDNIVESVNTLSDTTEFMKSCSKEADELMSNVIVYTDKTDNAIVTVSEQVEATSVSVDKIKQAIELITSIAKQTSLLSLNASIEAARAGDSGRGFAVVASEIQKLAEGSSKSAKEITQTVTELIDAANTMVNTMEQVKQLTGEQKTAILTTKDKFNNVVLNADKVMEEVSTIEVKTKECGIARDAIVDIISNLSAISQENAASTEETSASMDELNESIALLAKAANNLKELSQSLHKDIQFFKN